MTSITFRTNALIFSFTLPALTLAQEFEPGYIDPEPILAAASAAIGEDRLSCISISGSAYTGMVGQQYVNACLLYTSPSPRDQRGSGMAACA